MRGKRLKVLMIIAVVLLIAFGSWLGQHLQTNGKRFKQMCCVANFRGGHASFIGSSWDDLVKIGEESAPWFCSENNVYIAFEFNPKSQGERPETNSSDILKRV